MRHAPAADGAETPALHCVQAAAQQKRQIAGALQSVSKRRLGRLWRAWAVLGAAAARQRRATASAATQACLLACEERLAAITAQVC